MKEDYWVLGVLHDLNSFAKNRGMCGLQRAIALATDEFLDDMRAQNMKVQAHNVRKDCDPVVGKVVQLFPKQFDLP
jgi:hypothetical protein